MKIVEVDKLPMRRATRHNLQDIIKGFVNSDARFVKIELAEGDYKSVKVCYNCMKVACGQSGYSVKTKMRNNEVYLVKE